MPLFSVEKPGKGGSVRQILTPASSPGPAALAVRPVLSRPSGRLGRGCVADPTGQRPATWGTLAAVRKIAKRLAGLGLRPCGKGRCGVADRRYGS